MGKFLNLFKDITKTDWWVGSISGVILAIGMEQLNWNMFMWKWWITIVILILPLNIFVRFILLSMRNLYEKE